MPDISELIPAMHESNFITSRAHPGKGLFRNEEEMEISFETLDVIIDAGIDGIEPFAHKHTPEQTTLFIKEALNRGLLITGGSDYHGNEDHSISYPLNEEYTNTFLEKL